MVDMTDLRILRELQDGLALTPKPYQEAAERIGVPVDELLSRLEKMIEEGAVRRMGASIAHRSIGYTANAMTVWDVPDERAEEVGRLFAAHPRVTHCYERPRFEDWPWNMYTMVHGQTREECERIVEELSQESGVTEYRILFSEREFKKTGVRI